MLKTPLRMAIVSMLTFTCGCASMLKPHDSKADANENWRKVRAQLKYQQALDGYKANQLEKAEHILGEVLGLYDEFGDAYVLMTKLLLEKGETSAASDALDKALQMGADSPETDYLSGMIAQRYERFGVALDWYKRAVERAPNEVHYVLAMAEMYVKLERAAEALEIAKARWPDFDSSAALRVFVGKVHMMLSQYEEAAVAFRAARQIDTKDLMVTYDLGMALFYSNQYSEARDVLSSIDQDKTIVPTSIVMALGQCSLALSAADDAKEQFRHVVERNPKHALGWSLLARSSMLAGDMLTARRAATKAYELEPGNSQHALLLGAICYRQQDHRTAEQVLRMAVLKLDDEPLGFCLLGRNHEAMGQVQEARRCYQKALEIAPDDVWARYLLEEVTSSEDDKVLEVSSLAP